MTFKEFLIKYDIPFKIDEFNENNVIIINDKLLIPYENEIRKEVKDFEFLWDYQRYKNEPNRVSDE